MYTPKPNEETRVEVMHALVRAHPLGTWTLFDGNDLVTNHVPFLLDAGRGPFGTLVGHLARANPLWRAPPTAVQSVVSFQGPQAYVTPSWYASKAEHGKVVPTWNYAVVHTDRMLGAIVGVEIPVLRLLGKWKTSQNRPHADKVGVVTGLRERGDDASGDLVARHVLDGGDALRALAARSCGRRTVTRYMRTDRPPTPRARTTTPGAPRFTQRGRARRWSSALGRFRCSRRSAPSEFGR